MPLRSFEEVYQLYPFLRTVRFRNRMHRARVLNRIRRSHRPDSYIRRIFGRLPGDPYITRTSRDLYRPDTYRRIRELPTELQDHIVSYLPSTRDLYGIGSSGATTIFSRS